MTAFLTLISVHFSHSRVFAGQDAESVIYFYLFRRTVSENRTKIIPTDESAGERARVRERVRSESTEHERTRWTRGERESGRMGETARRQES